MSIYMFSFIYVWFLVRGFFFKFIVLICRDVPVLKKNLENRITSVQDLFILKNAVTLNKIVPSMYVFLKINVEQKCISESMRYIQTI